MKVTETNLPGVLISDMVDVEYKRTDYYDPQDEITVLWNDPAIGIDWPVTEPTLSARDRSALPLAELMGRLPRYPER